MNQALKDRFITKLANGNYYGLALVLSDTKKNVNGNMIKSSSKGVRNLSTKLGSMIGRVCGEIGPDRSKDPTQGINISNAVGVLQGFCVKIVGDDIHVYTEITPSSELVRVHENICKHIFTCYSKIIHDGPNDFILDDLITVNAVPIMGYDFPITGPYPTNLLEDVKSFTPL